MKRGLFKIALGSVCSGSTLVGAYCTAVSQRPDSEKLHIVLDLDSTVLQSYPIKSYENLNHRKVRVFDHTILTNGETDDGIIGGYYVWYRPFSHTTLRFLSSLFNVHMFTAATRDYGEACLEKLPDVFQKKLYRDSVTEKDSHGKDLTLVTTEKVVLVDDQLRNRTGEQEFYHIPPYSRLLRQDLELLKLCGWAIWWNFTHDLKKRA